MKNSKTKKHLSLVVAILFCIIAPIGGYVNIGLPPVIIVGGSAIIGFFFWLFTYYKNPTDPKLMLPLFIITVAALHVHIIEEYLSGFGPAMSRLYDITWTEESFLMIFALVGPTIYILAALGLYYKNRIAGFIAWFIIIGCGIGEFTHFIFPLIQPQLAPNNVHNITQVINGVTVANMPNYFFKTTGHYYFAGMWTAIIPIAAGLYSIFRLVKYQKKAKSHTN